MMDDFGRSEESMQGKPYDVKLLKRIYPFVRNFGWLVSGSILLVTLITLLDLSIPYITKVAIDRYIVPTIENGDSRGAKGGAAPVRRLKMPLDDPGVSRVVARYPALFLTNGTSVEIAYEDFSRLDRKDRVALRKPHVRGLGRMALIFLCVIVMNFMLNFFQKLLMEYSGHRIMHELRMQLFNHVQSLSVSFFTRTPVARLVTRLTNDIQNMHELFTSVLSLLFKDLFLLVGIAVVLMVMNWRLALVSFTILPLVLLTAFTFSSRIRDVFRGLRVKVAEINARFSETVGGMKVIQSFVKEAENYRRFSQLNHENYLLGMRQIHIFAIFMPIIEVLGVVSIAVVIFYGGQGVLDDTISLGVLVAFISYMKMFFRPIRDLAEKYNILQNAMASAERIFHLMDSRERLPISPGALSDKENRFLPLEEIRFDKVSFAYIPGETVLDNISFRLKAGETLAVVGATGSGKTSLIQLMIRFYDPTSGRIQVNGQNIAGADPARLRSILALVPQDPFLFTGTIRDNILLGQALNDDAWLEQVVKAASCEALIQRLPQGLDTRLGEGGASLSSGERQLISLARAFARNPSLIILDEATSYVDSQTELHLHRAIDNLMAGRTSIVIAHRLTTARNADQIMVLHDGHIAETGHHEALMARKGFYYRMVQYQNGETFNPEGRMGRKA